MYAQVDDMIRLFGQREILALADPENTGAVNEGIVEDALSAASSEIDSYLAGRYERNGLPLDPAPRHLIRVACDIARYHLTGNDRLETEPIRERYKSAVRFLELAAAGKITLGPNAQGNTPNPSGSVQFIAGHKVFGRDGGVY